MPKPKDAKVWNEDLVQALSARHEQARQQNSNRQIGWAKAAEKIGDVRQEIYRFNSGRIVGLPTNLSKTVSELCRRIIDGTAPILPPGFNPTTLEEQRNCESVGNPFDNYPYVKTIKKRGGAFAMLMAFHVSGRQTMSKDQLCRAAQPYCDDEMEANYMAGRAHGAWTGIKTLNSHGLVHTQKARVAYSERAGGLRAQGKNSYTLTRDGELFIEALFRRNPEMMQQYPKLTGISSPVRPVVNDFLSNLCSRGAPVTPITPATLTTVVKSVKTASKQEDELKLREWVQTAQPSEQVVFKVGKSRRSSLHDLCDTLSSSVLRPMGRTLLHESHGNGRGRHLYVTLMATDSRDGAYLVDSPTRASAKLETVQPFSGAGKELETGSPFKRRRCMTAREAAAQAALERQAVHDSILSANRRRKGENERRVAALPKNLSLQQAVKPTPAAALPPRSNIVDLLNDTDSEEDRKLPAQPRKLDFSSASSGLEKRKPFPFDNSSDDDDDGDILAKYRSPFSTAKPAVFEKNKPSSIEPEVVDLTESQEYMGGSTSFSTTPQEEVASKTETPGLTIWIDSRERSKNCLPRQLRMDLNRFLDSSIFTRAAPRAMLRPSVCEKALAIGDFSFSLQSKDAQDVVIPVSVERKRIGDLVQRSGSQDHWRQFQSMRDNSRFSVFLLEGDFRGAGTNFSPFGNDPDISRLSQDIEDEESLIRFIGRAIYGCKTARFIQSKEEQGSLRAVAALGLVSAMEGVIPLSQENSPTAPKTEQRRLRDRLSSAGLPLQVASRVVAEVGSTKHLEKLYSTAETEGCKEQLLSHLLIDTAQKIESLSSALGWSAAVYHAYTSKTHHAFVKKTFEEMKHLVEDHALLLVKLHKNISPAKAVDEVLERSSVQVPRSRKTHVAVPPVLRALYRPSASGGFIDISVAPSKEIIPFVSINTSDGDFKSETVTVFLVEGDDVVSTLSSTTATQTNLYECATRAADTLFSSMSIPNRGSNIILVRGLQPALDRIAKQKYFLPETKFLVDVMFAHLMLRHQLVVLQAVRKTNDAELMLEQLTMACMMFQYLTLPQK